MFTLGILLGEIFRFLDRFFLLTPAVVALILLLKGLMISFLGLSVFGFGSFDLEKAFKESKDTF